MPGEGSSFRSIPRTAHPRNLLGSDNEPTENEFEASLSSLHFPPPRTPLNSIPDPSQCHKDTPHGSDFNDCKDKPETTRPGRMSDRKLEGLDRSGTPRIFNNRQGKAHSEPNSAQSTPARSGSRVSLGGGGAMGSLSATGARSTLFSKGKEMNFCGSRGSRGISSSANSELNAVEVSHFELDENPSFWRDHNVQVLIRIRPLSNMERASPGYGRCMRQESGQTLVWLGHPETRFTFDHIACETISQEKLFRVAGLPMVENCLSGYNSCMFAYGQTGSGKTYTMMGEINPVEGKLGEYRGITPRIFEYLFSRIEMEEEGRRDEKLKFSCKCSFLEIYNEQITDLLEPASTNLQLREDLNKGVYVENLTECNVRTVDDVIKLLLQGAANRKMAATHMNSESSRSHSVFTCIIESSWERDSLSHFRFARLNLVDLAGSERQKSSGAEGDRLKEAANINKSLSTLGLVIMSLVDIAHGKHRHVPYRDSRLTFLLQDSLGGNSKTTIIANVSPSVCSANETLSTLKFAQRAKLIQNNAKVNEDASGDVGALQRQIQQLKDQLSFLMKNHNHSTSLFGCIQSFEASGLADDPEIYNSSEGKGEMSDRNIFSIINKKMKCMEATLTGALRREKMAEIALHKLEAEIEHLNRLARQREDDLQRTKMLLRFREDKIKQLELSVNGSLPADHYLTEENKALREEIQILQERIDKNPEVTRFALENIRLIEQLQLFQNYYELGERETLLSEISELRDQLLETLERKPELFSRHEKKDDNTVEELEDCRNMNSRLMREVDELRGKLSKYLTCNQASFDSASNSQTKDPDEIRHTDKYSLVETISSGSISDDEIALYTHTDDVSLQSEDERYRNVALAIQPGDTKKELKDTNLITKPMKSEQAHLINELQLMRDQNCRFMEIVNKKDKRGGESPYELGRDLQELQNLERENIYRETSEDTKSKDLRGRLEKLTKDLEEARLANCQYQEDRASLLSQHNQMELVCEQVEMETSQTILHLEEEVNALQLELNERLCCMTQENLKLRNQVAAKDEEIRKVCGEWERAALELTSFLVEGSRSLKDASGEIQRIACSFPQINVQTGEQVKRAARACIDKEEMILQLEKSLEDAQKMVVEMELKLDSLKQATMALNRLPQSENEDSAEETIHIGMLLNEKISTVKNLESKVKFHEDNIIELEKRADAAFLVVKWLSDRAEVAQANCSERAIHIPKLDSLTQDIKAQLKLENMIIDCEAAIGESLKDAERHIATLQMDVLDMSTTYLKLVQNSIEEINEMRSKFTDAKVNQVATVKLQVSEPKKLREFGKELDSRYRIIDELAKMNERLRKIKDSIDSKISASGSLLTEEYLTEADSSADNSTSGYSTSSSDGSIGSVSCTFCYEFSEEMMDIRKSQEQSVVEAEPESSKKLLKSSCQTEEVTFCPRKELERTFDAFHVLYSYVTKVLNENDIWDSTRKAGKINEVESFRSGMETVEACCTNTRQAVAADKVNRTFFSNCEEVRATMKEADYMLNALLKAHESAQQMNGMWRQTSQELMQERSMLIEENEQLKSSVLLKEAENKLLQEEISRGLVEVASSMSLLEGCFQQLRSEVEDKYKLFYLDILSMGRQMLCLVSNSRSSLEEIHSEIMERGFSLSALHHCGEEILYKTPRVNVQPGFCPFRPQESQIVRDTMQSVCSSSQDDIMNACKQKIEEASVENQCRLVTKIEGRDLDLSHEEPLCENLSLKKELERKEILLKGLLFDFSLLQETASNKKDVKDETEKLILALTDIRHELEMKTSEVDDLLVQHRKLESLRLDTENALSISRSDLEQAEERIESLSDQNAELRMLLKDLYVKKSEAEVQLEEQKDVVKGLEKEIIHLNSSVEEKVRSSVELLEEDLRNVSNERDQLQKEIFSLNEKLEMAYALADENEAIAVEARQESERSKLYAEQKEEEVKILEHSVEELESTINMLEKKVYEMNEEVERHRSIRDSLELELEAWRQKLSKVQNLTDFVDTECGNSLQIQDLISRQLESRLLELQAAHNQIRVLEKHISDKDKEIKQCKEYISELVLHSEAQASQYQEKYKTLEAMVHEVKMNSASVAAVLDKSEKISMRTRGSSSPFRCISSLVQQMHLEKDQELSVARLRIEELEAVLASRQKEVCMLNARLAAAESMTHDVIRDLLLVKLDMTNYANLIDQHQVQKLVEEAHHQTEEFLAKEQEVINLRKQIDDIIEERESCQSELDKKAADILAAEMTVEQLQDRDQMLSAQNEMLKKDKSNLLRKISELDDMVKTLLGTQSTQNQIKQTSKTKDNGALRLGDADLTKKLARSEKLLNRVNDELVQYRKSTGSRPHSKTHGHPSESKHR